MLSIPTSRTFLNHYFYPTSSSHPGPTGTFYIIYVIGTWWMIFIALTLAVSDGRVWVMLIALALGVRGMRGSGWVIFIANAFGEADVGYGFNEHQFTEWVGMGIVPEIIGGVLSSG